jgi:hypothetical protein
MNSEQRRREAEETPAMEVHLGEVTELLSPTRVRHCIIWLNGKRWEGTLQEVKPDGERRADASG